MLGAEGARQQSWRITEQRKESRKKAMVVNEEEE